MDIDFKELSADEEFVTKMTEFIKSVDHIQEVFKYIEDPELYDKLTRDQKIQFDLLMSFTLNSLFWMNLKLEGINPQEHPIKGENERLKVLMSRYKQVCDKKKRQKVNVEAAGRFIRNSLWVPVVPEKTKDGQSNQINSTENWDKESEEVNEITSKEEANQNAEIID